MIALERVDDPAVQRNFDAINAALGLLAEVPFFVMPSGTPEGSITASPPAICLVRAGGADVTMFLKVTGSATNTGWKAVENVP